MSSGGSPFLDASAARRRVDEDTAALIAAGRAGIADFGFDPALCAEMVSRLGRLGRPATILSTGCHVASETYTLAMHLLDAGLTSVSVYATDASAACVRRGESGVFGRGCVNVAVASGRLPQAMVDRYFDRLDADLVRVSDEVRAAVTFLPPSWVPEEVRPADVVLLRNVWVHLHPLQRQALVDKLAATMPADGLVAFRTMNRREVEQVMAPTSHPRLFRRPDPGARLDLEQCEPATDWLHRTDADEVVIMTPDRLPSTCAR